MPFGIKAIAGKFASAARHMNRAIMPSSRTIAIGQIVTEWREHDEANLLSGLSEDKIRECAGDVVDRMAYLGMGDSSASTADVEEDLLRAQYDFIARHFAFDDSEIGMGMRSFAKQEFGISIQALRDQRCLPDTPLINAMP